MHCSKNKLVLRRYTIGKAPSLSELTPIIYYMEFTHLGSDVSIYYCL